MKIIIHKSYGLDESRVGNSYPQAKISASPDVAGATSGSAGQPDGCPGSLPSPGYVRACRKPTFGRAYAEAKNPLQNSRRSTNMKNSPKPQNTSLVLTVEGATGHCPDPLPYLGRGVLADGRGYWVGEGIWNTMNLMLSWTGY